MMTGKRKRDQVVARRLERSPSLESADPKPDLFRKYFESRFEPLEESFVTTATLAEGADEDLTSDDGSSSDLEWQGLSDNGTSEKFVEVVELSKPEEEQTVTTRSAEFRSFMVWLGTRLLA